MDDHFVQLGQREIWGGEQAWGITGRDRTQHMIIIGKTGVGKSELLKQAIASDIASGLGVVVIDPHGDLADAVLDLIPPHRSNDLILYSAWDLEHPIGFNMLTDVPETHRHLVVDNIISALKAVWSDSWGPRLNFILANSLSALTECQNVSLLSVGRMLVDDRYRHWVLKHVRNAAVLHFFAQEYEKWDNRFRYEAISPVLNKVNSLLLSPVLRNSLGNVRSAFSPRWVLDSKKVFVANLARGKLGLETSSLLGSLLVSAFGLAAMSRADIPAADRQPVTLFIDEFPSLAGGDSLAVLLSESRKFALSIFLIAQHFSQIRPDVLDSILGNVGTFVSFRVSDKDAQILSRQFSGAFHPDAFTNLGNFEVAVKMLSNGKAQEPFLGRTLPDDHIIYGRREMLIRNCRERYATPRRVIEDKIARWME